MVYDQADDKAGRIAFIGKETNEESDKILKSGKTVTPIFNDSDELDGDSYYDE